MKLQFDGSVARLRAGRAELVRLREGGTLAVEVPWPGQRWRLEVTAGPALLLATAPERVLLTLPAGDLDGLAARLPAREGLAYRMDLGNAELELRFEVDIRDGRARAR